MYTATDSSVRRRECCGVAVQQMEFSRFTEVSVQSATRKSESSAPEATERKSAPAARRAKLSVVLLVTRDDLLWPQIGTHLGKDLILKQLDSVDELLTAIPSGQSAIVLLDARNQTDAAAELTRLQLHSPRLAVGGAGRGRQRRCLDTPHRASASRRAFGGADTARQIDRCRGEARRRKSTRAWPCSGTAAARHPLPPRPQAPGASAGTEASAGARASAGTEAPAAPTETRRIPWMPASIIAGVLVAGAAAFVLLRHGDVPANRNRRQPRRPRPRHPASRPPPMRK